MFRPFSMENYLSYYFDRMCFCYRYWQLHRVPGHNLPWHLPNRGNREIVPRSRPEVAKGVYRWRWQQTCYVDRWRWVLTLHHMSICQIHATTLTWSQNLVLEGLLDNKQPMFILSLPHWGPLFSTPNIVTLVKSQTLRWAWGTIFRVEDGGSGDSMFLQKTGICPQVHTALPSRRPTSTCVYLFINF